MTDFMQFIGANFLIKAPSNWLVLSSNAYQTLWLSPPLSAKNPLHANLSLIVTLVENMTVEEHINKLIRDQEAQFAQYQKLDEREIQTDSGEIGFQLTSKWFNTNKNAEVLQSQTHFVDGQILYLFTATRPLVLEAEVIEAVDTIFETMLSSFRLETLPLFA